MLQFQTFSTPLNSAIGFYNYKYYLLTLFYGVVSMVWVLGSCMPEVVATWPPFSSCAASADPTACTPDFLFRLPFFLCWGLEILSLGLFLCVDLWCQRISWAPSVQDLQALRDPPHYHQKVVYPWAQ